MLDDAVSHVFAIGRLCAAICLRERHYPEFLINGSKTIAAIKKYRRIIAVASGI